MAENIVARVHKLLRLSTSSNANEAAAAAAKAQELIDTHNLSEEMLRLDSAAPEVDEPILDFSDKEALDDSSPIKLIRWKTALGSKIAQLNGCRLWRSSGVLHIVGRPSDVETVRYLYGYLSHEVERLTTVNGRGCGRTWKNNYRLGCVDSINNTLYTQHKQFAEAQRGIVAGNSTALMRVNNALAKIERRGGDVQLFMEKKMGFKFKNKPLSQGRSIDKARAAGQRDGKEVKINAAKGGIGSGVKGHLND